MTNEEAIKILQNDGCCQDCTFGGYPCKLTGCETHQAINLAIKALEERPQGEWIIDGHHRRCKKCGEYFCIADSEGNEIPSNFCPNCGTKMQQGD